jgi:hypothetical protein
MQTSVVRVAGLSCLLTGASGAAQAAVIASDSLLTTATATSGYYVQGNVNGQASLNGTTGYYTGAAAGNQIAGWNSGTGAFLAQVGGLTHPLLVNGSTTNDGSLVAAGNANNRLQYRDLASTAPAASSDYYFSALLREASNSYVGTTYVGLGPSRALGANAAVPNTAFQVGFLNGALTLFYGNGTTTYSTETLVATPAANSTYLAELDYNVATGALTPRIYDSTGAVANNPVLQTVVATVNTSTDLGAFDAFITADFNNQTPTKVTFDEFRFGTAQADVAAVPEPGAVGLLGVGVLAAAGRRRRGK